jgi:hypothetical protein
MESVVIETGSSQRGAASQPADRTLWFGLLGAPVAWFVHFLAIWAIAEWGCLAGWGRFTILGLDTIAVLLAIATMLVLPIMAVASIIAWRNWRAGASEAERDSWRVYMGLGGGILGVLFGTLVVLETIPAFVLMPCG